MRLEESEIKAWMRPFTAKKGDAWPKQVTFRELLRDGELHRFDDDAHVLVCRAATSSAAYLITTAELLEEGLPAAELAFAKALLSAWAPRQVWVAWVQRDRRMGQGYAALCESSGLQGVTKKKLSGWAISIDLKREDLERLIRG